LVLYPQPGLFAVSLYRLHKPPLEPALVSDLASELWGAAPDEIQETVYIWLPYSYDWQTYNMPWYFPTLEEALETGRGDCKARYLLFASLLEELEIPYQKNLSLSHIWVSYEGKIDNRIENEGESFVTFDETGRASFSFPRTSLSRFVDTFKHSFWEIMPPVKKILLALGFPVAFILTPQSMQNKKFIGI